MEISEIEVGGVWNLGNYENVRLSIRAKAAKIGDVVELVSKLARCVAVLRRAYERYERLISRIKERQDRVIKQKEEMKAIENEFKDIGVELEKASPEELASLDDPFQEKYRKYLNLKQWVLENLKEIDKLKNEANEIYRKYSDLKNLLNDNRVEDALEYINKELRDLLNTSYDP